MEAILFGVPYLMAVVPINLSHLELPTFSNLTCHLKETSGHSLDSQPENFLQTLRWEILRILSFVSLFSSVTLLHCLLSSV